MLQANGWQDAIVAIVVLVVNASEPHSTELHAINDVQGCFRQALVRDQREHRAKLTFSSQHTQAYTDTYTETKKHKDASTQTHI